MNPTATAAPDRAAQARLNGARSSGPTSPEGKARSAANARRYGFRSGEFWLLPDEDPDAFAALHASKVRLLAPVGEDEEALVRDFVCAEWKAIRADRLEAALLGDVFAAETAGERLRLTRSLGTLTRYRAQIDRDQQRALKTLLALKDARRATARRAGDSPQSRPDAPVALVCTNEPSALEAALPPGPLSRAERRGLAAIERRNGKRAAA
jgi:hypothetical protein